MFAAVAVLLSVAATLTALTAFDVYLHHKFERAAGLNVWGYRGRPVGRKKPHEVRVAVLGGSTVLGFGLDEGETFPYQLEGLLNASATAPTTYRVVNLGYNQNGAYSFRYTLEDYAYLDYDVVCLYEGYNDLGNQNRRVSRRDWIVYRLTGYMPIIPIVLSEKITQLRHGDVRGQRADAPVVFRPGIVSRTKAEALAAAKAISDSVERQLRSVNNSEGEPGSQMTAEDCGVRWTFYCRSVVSGIDYARAHRKPVLVVTQPYGGKEHRAQQRDLQTMLPLRYGKDPAVQYVNLGGTVDVTDPDLCWDGMHLTAKGNRRIAEALVPAVRAAMSP